MTTATTFSSRIYYRNTFLHIGHLQTLYHNNDFAKQKEGVCYAIIDDRQNHMRSIQIQEDLDFLGIDSIKIISVNQHSEPINLYTKELAESGIIYIPGMYNILECIRHPKSNFQLKLNYGNHPTIGYSKQLDNGSYIIIYIFDYIIKVLDDLLNITDVVSTTPNDVADIDIMDFFVEKHPLKFHYLEPYKIIGFRYSKKDWPSLPENDPRLMTIRGLKARHIPAEVIYKFYTNAIAKYSIKITYFDTILKNQLSLTAKYAFGVIDPIKITISNMEDRYTEFIFKAVHPMKSGAFNIAPLSNTVYIDRSDFSLIEHSNKLSKEKEIRLKYANVLYCTDVDISKEGVIMGITGKYYQKDTAPQKTQIHWVSVEAGKQPVKVKFYMYSWFFTGDNMLNIQEPVVKDGYIDNCVFEDLSQIYNLERIGYFVYDSELSAKNALPCFIKICNASR